MVVVRVDRSKRRGVGLIEVVFALAVLGVLGAIALPRRRGTAEREAVRTAKQQVAAYLAQARTLSVRSARSAWFIRSGNAIRVLADTGTGAPVAVGSQDLYTQNAVQVTASRDTIQFDP